MRECRLTLSTGIVITLPNSPFPAIHPVSASRWTKRVRRCTLPRQLAVILSFVATTAICAAQLDDELARVERMVDAGSAKDAWSELEQMTDAPFPFRRCLSNGVCIGWIYFDLKMRAAEAMGNPVDALDAARYAERHLPLFSPQANVAAGERSEPHLSTLSTLSTNAPADERRNVVEIPAKTQPTPPSDIKSLCAARTYAGMARNARKIGKNFTSEQYAHRVLSMTNIPESITVPAAIDLTELYLNQARYKDAHTVITNLFAHAKQLPKDAFVTKAKTEFWLGRNSDAFSDLLSVLYTDGLQEKAPWNDPALRLFLIRIGRADEQDIAALYDALKAQLDYEELVAGKEELLAFLIQERMLLARIFPYLEEEKDLKKLEQRLAKDERLREARGKAVRKLQKARKDRLSRDTTGQ